MANLALSSFIAFVFFGLNAFANNAFPMHTPSLPSQFSTACKGNYLGNSVDYPPNPNGLTTDLVIRIDNQRMQWDGEIVAKNGTVVVPIHEAFAVNWAHAGGDSFFWYGSAVDYSKDGFDVAAQIGFDWGFTAQGGGMVTIDQCRNGTPTLPGIFCNRIYYLNCSSIDRE